MPFNAPMNVPSTTTTCYHDKETLVNKDTAHMLAVGISHYQKRNDGSVWKSYVQVHETMYCSSRDKAVQAAHARIDKHASMPHGEYNKEVLNPANEFADAVVKGATEYHLSPVAWASLPQVDAITNTKITTDVYVPHVDDSSRGMCYQDIILSNRKLQGDFGTVTVGTSTLENAIKLSHKIVDDVIQADYNGLKV